MQLTDIGTCTSTSTPTNDTGDWECITITTVGNDYCFKLEKIHLTEEKEWIKTGWNNPRKFSLPKNIFRKNIHRNIRNTLPIKIRRD